MITLRATAYNISTLGMATLGKSCGITYESAECYSLHVAWQVWSESIRYGGGIYTCIYQSSTNSETHEHRRNSGLTSHSDKISLYR